ncbi:stress response RCI peptide [Cordyceps militaris CM01]|uniref:Stress response RCI peptide n=1 Tax=Cordyceps militaris (strain CM01) TaxID=983644 RepID=G3JS85_CORMM|nr:stress response RCI peptide [Cordyceps militaris CM01]EGX88784.1 stress response RCI peptide [Cordyceps militaris CM01]
MGWALPGLLHLAARVTIAPAAVGGRPEQKPRLPFTLLQNLASTNHFVLIRNFLLFCTLILPSFPWHSPHTSQMCSADIFLGVLAILFPPLPVWVKCGICSADSLINILLCLLGYVPGLLHAWYIIAKFPEPPYEYETLNHGGEGGCGRVTYVYVPSPHGQHQPRPQQQGGMNYGGTSGGAQQQQGVTAANDNGAGRSDGQVPPSYAAAVAGDHKVQSHD